MKLAERKNVVVTLECVVRGTMAVEKGNYKEGENGGVEVIW